MLAQAVRPLVRLVDRYLPDPYVFVLILTLLVMVAAVAVEGRSPMAVIGMWGNGFWDLLAFSMQMLLVLVTGFMLASTPPVKRVLAAIARSVRSPGAAIITVSLVSLCAHVRSSSLGPFMLFHRRNLKWQGIEKTMPTLNRCPTDGQATRRRNHPSSWESPRSATTASAQAVSAPAQIFGA
jgi:hypothetical protein